MCEFTIPLNRIFNRCWLHQIRVVSLLLDHSLDAFLVGSCKHRRSGALHCWPHFLICWKVWLLFFCVWGQQMYKIHDKNVLWFLPVSTDNWVKKRKWQRKEVGKIVWKKVRELTRKKARVLPPLSAPYLIFVCFDKSSALSMGESILSTVRKAARLAVYDEIMIRVKNHQIPATTLLFFSIFAICTADEEVPKFEEKAQNETKANENNEKQILAREFHRFRLWKLFF